MCIDEKTSRNTFIIGTLINSAAITNILYKNTINKTGNFIRVETVCLILLWQYILMMQIPDWLAWRHMRLYPGKEIPKSYGILASLLNYTQPLAILIVLLIIRHYKRSTKTVLLILPGIASLFVYCGFVIYNLCTEDIDFSLEPCGPKCSLGYRWWTKIQIILYLLTCTLLILAIPSNPMVITNLSIFWGSFFISMLINYIRTNSTNNVGLGSLWCWTVGFAGLIIYIVYLLKYKGKNNLK